MMGYTLVFWSCFIKLPQIAKMEKNKSAVGVSVLSVYAEILSYLYTIADSWRLGISFSVYGEAVFITIQNWLILGLVWEYGRHSSPNEILGFFSSLTVFCYIIFWGGLSNESWVYVDYFAVLLVLLTRLPQIYRSYKT
jgi:mannose-P-dolichol utilization defect protein 1